MNVIWTKFNHMVDGSKATASVSSSQHADRTYGCYLDQVQPHGGRF